MSTFNTLLFVQTDLNLTETSNEANNQPTSTTEPAPTSAPVQEAPANKGFGTGWIFILLIIVVFYFFMIRPQSKRAKDERKFREALKKGDKIVTTAGIHGKIVEIDETTAVIETEGLGKLRIEKAAIAKNQPS